MARPLKKPRKKPQVRPITESTRTTRVSRISRIMKDLDLSGTAALVQIYGGEVGVKYPLIEEATTIGRTAECSIVVAMDNVSRNHCVLRTGIGVYTIEDLSSTNGTFVNDKAIRGDRDLRHGDLIRVGGAIFKFLDGDNIEQLYHEEVYRMAIIDGLTQIHNKRYFIQFLEREHARCRRHSRPLTLIMFDIDHFKKINDQFGHLAGDRVLNHIATLVQSKTIRKEECFARYGGEEFAIVLPDTTAKKGVVLAEKIRKLIEKADFAYEGHPISVTVSLGVAQLGQRGNAGAFIADCDEKLYQAKRTGRNRVCV